MLQTDAEARTRAVQGPLFKPKTPEYEYELKSRYRKAENQALSKIQHRREDMADIPKYDEAGQQVVHGYTLIKFCSIYSQTHHRMLLVLVSFAAV